MTLLNQLEDQLELFPPEILLQIRILALETRKGRKLGKKGPVVVVVQVVLAAVRLRVKVKVGRVAPQGHHHHHLGANREFILPPQLPVVQAPGEE